MRIRTRSNSAPAGMIDPNNHMGKFMNPGSIHCEH